MNDPDPLRPATGDQGRLTGAGSENLVGVDLTRLRRVVVCRSVSAPSSTMNAASAP